MKCFIFPSVQFSTKSYSMTQFFSNKRCPLNALNEITHEILIALYISTSSISPRTMFKLISLLLVLFKGDGRRVPIPHFILDKIKWSHHPLLSLITMTTSICSPLGKNLCRIESIFQITFNVIKGKTQDCET